MKKTAGILPLLLILALSGCAADTTEAQANCRELLLLPYTFDDSNFTTVEYATAIGEVSQLCKDSAEADPEGFIEEWSR